MYTRFTEKYLGIAQSDMYHWQNTYANAHPILGRASVIPIAVADVFLQTLKAPLNAIEAIAVAALNLIGFLFKEQCTLKEGLLGIEKTGVCLLGVAVVVPFAPVKLVYQIFAGIYDSKNIQSINFTQGDWRKQPAIFSLFPKEKAPETEAPSQKGSSKTA